MLLENACKNNGPANKTVTFYRDILSTRVLSVLRLGEQSAKAGKFEMIVLSTLSPGVLCSP